MKQYDTEAITQRLSRWNTDQIDAWDLLLPQIYDQLRYKANYVLSQFNQANLEPTALVHELYINFRSLKNIQWKNRQHFFAVASLAMRQILLKEIERNHALKRGKHYIRVSTVELDSLEAEWMAFDLIDLDRSLFELEKKSPDACRIVELRYFGGLSTSEISDILCLSERTIRRKWEWAQTWLFRQLSVK